MAVAFSFLFTPFLDRGFIAIFLALFHHCILGGWVYWGDEKMATTWPLVQKEIHSDQLGRKNSGWYLRLNSGPHTCQASNLPLNRFAGSAFHILMSSTIEWNFLQLPYREGRGYLVDRLPAAETPCFLSKPLFSVDTYLSFQLRPPCSRVSSIIKKQYVHFLAKAW